MAGKPFSELDEELQSLVEIAFRVKELAYCPYSNFHVGAAVLTEDGTKFAGCNVENASYGLSICAERNAILSAVSGGHRKFKVLAVSCDIKDSFKGPCGACRQFLIEFGLDWDVLLVKPNKTWLRMHLRDLVPLPFSPEALEAERITNA